MKKLNNKGFSLVELIIVIAIMAILVGVLAPQLIKYIEKAKVSSDTQIADTMHSAITYALMDPEVNSANDGSEIWVSRFTTGSGFVQLFPGMYSETNCKFTETVEEILGFNPWTTSEADMGFKSTTLSGYIAPRPMAKMNASGTAFAVYLSGTDRTGNKNPEAGGSPAYEDLENHRWIFVK